VFTLNPTATCSEFRRKRMTKKEIILLWTRTQRGHIDECREAQLKFSDMMWGLYDKLKKKGK
tara:strand:+ start:503 stop:688 length:186 start_codon:yes stop_codon:yes gene_type:complete